MRIFRRSWSVVSILLVAAFVLPGVAQAAASGAAGVIVSLSPATRTITVERSDNGTQVMLRAVERSSLTRNGKVVRFAALALRDRVEVRFQRASSTITRLDARGPALEGTRGVLTGFDAASGLLSLGTVRGARSFRVGPATLVVRNGAASTAQALVRGDALLVHAPSAPAGTVAVASDIAADGVEEEEVEGTITTLAGSDVTITPRSGAAVTVQVTAATVIRLTDASGTHPATLADLATGQRAEAEYDPVSLVADHLQARVAQEAEPAEVEGRLTAVDATAGTLLIDPEHGAEVALHADATTRISRNGAPATLADLRVGDEAEARYNATTFLAGRIEAHSEHTQPPATSEVEGNVTAVSATSITLAPSHGSPVTLTLDATTRITIHDHPATAADIHTGDRAEARYVTATLLATRIEVEGSSEED